MHSVRGICSGTAMLYLSFVLSKKTVNLIQFSQPNFSKATVQSLVAYDHTTYFNHANFSSQAFNAVRYCCAL